MQKKNKKILLESLKCKKQATAEISRSACFLTGVEDDSENERLAVLHVTDSR